MKEFIESTAGAVLICCVGLVIFSGAGIMTAIFLPTNEAIYVMFANLVGNFSGSLFTILRIRGTNVEASGRSVEVNVQQQDKPKKEQL